MERCQCPKPESIKVIVDSTSFEVVPLWAIPDNILHYKAADRYCKKCGMGLCEDCSYFNNELDFFFDANHVCIQCAESAIRIAEEE